MTKSKIIQVGHLSNLLETWLRCKVGVSAYLDMIFDLKMLIVCLQNKIPELMFSKLINSFPLMCPENISYQQHVPVFRQTFKNPLLNHSGLVFENKNNFRCHLLGVLAPGSAHAWPSARPLSTPPECFWRKCLGRR